MVDPSASPAGAGAEPGSPAGLVEGGDGHLFRLRQAVLRGSTGTVVAAGLTIALIAVLAWQGLLRWQRERIASVAALEAQGLQEALADHIGFLAEELERLAHRWEVRGGPPRAEWEADALAHLRHEPEYQALEWVDATGRVQWIVPAAGNEKALGRELRQEPLRRQAMDKACRSRAPCATPIVELLQGGKGILVFYPILRSGRCDGFMLGVVRVRGFLEVVLGRRQVAGWAVTVSDSTRPVFQRGSVEPLPAAHFIGVSAVDFCGTQLRIQVAAEPAKRAELDTHLAEVALLGILLSAVLVSLALFLAGRSHAHALEAERVSGELQAQMTENLRAQSKLVDHARLADLNAAVSVALTRGTELRPTLQACADAMVGTLDAAFVRIWTYNSDLDCLDLQASAGLCTHLDGGHACVSLDTQMFSIIARQRTPYMTNAVCDEPRIDRAWAAREGLTSFAGHPLIVDDRFVGAMVLFARKAQPDHVLDALHSIADILAVGIRRSRSEAALSVSQGLLRQAQKMEAVGRLAGGIAHDFNNILTVISANTEFILQEPELPTAVLQDAAGIKEAADRAASLTRQLLAFGRKQILQPRVLDITAVVGNMDRMLRRLIGEDIDLLTVLTPDLGHVLADPGQLEQVLLNLAVNARDAMPAGGKLTIETANVELDAAYATAHPGVEPGQFVMLAVSDNGCGMDAATVARVFEPFFTTKELGKGTGLGLATVYGIVRQSDGHVFVYSEQGTGTTFKVYLPCVDEPLVEERSTLGALPSMGQGRRILLVEDDPSVRLLAYRILTRAGFSVLQAEAPAAAVQFADREQGEIDLLLTDIVMPGKSGRMLAEEMLAANPRLKVVYMSGYTDEAIVRHGIVSSDVAFVQKPFTCARLLEVIGQVLRAQA